MFGWGLFLQGSLGLGSGCRNRVAKNRTARGGVSLRGGKCELWAHEGLWEGLEIEIEMGIASGLKPF